MVVVNKILESKRNSSFFPSGERQNGSSGLGEAVRDSEPGKQAREIDSDCSHGSREAS